MNKSVFKSVLLANDLANRIQLAQSMLEERGIPKDQAYNIFGWDMPNIRYLVSTHRDGVLLHNYFEYSKNEPFIGLARTDAGSDELNILTEDAYCKFVVLHDQVWLCLGKNSVYHLWVDGTLYDEPILSYDILRIGEDLFFVQLDYLEYRSLVCLIKGQAHQGYFAPRSLEDFDRWFSLQMSKQGYEGHLDGMNISQFYSLYYEVRNCIFMSATFKPLELTGDLTTHV